MSEFLRIEQLLLQHAQDPINRRLLRREIAHEFPEACVRHVVFDAYLDALIETDHIEEIDTEQSVKVKATVDPVQV